MPRLLALSSKTIANLRVINSGKIGGGSALKFGIYISAKNDNALITGSPQAQRVLYDRASCH